MNVDQLRQRNKVLEKRWKIVLIVAIVFVVTRPVALFIVNKFIHKAVEESKKNSYTFLDPTRNVLEDDDVIINVQPLRDDLNRLVTEEKDAVVTLYFEYLPTGANISINQDLKIWPVSLAKLPISMVTMKKIDEGIWTKETKLKFLPGDEDFTSGKLYEEGAGTEHSVAKLLELLLTTSDNTAYKILKRNMTEQEIASIVDEIGLGALFAPDGKVSSKDYSRLFRSLYTASYLTRQSSEEILELLSRNKFTEFASQGLGDSTFAHKQGENTNLNVYADSGIVYLHNRPYILSVMVQSKLEDKVEAKTKAAEFIESAARKTKDYISNYNKVSKIGQ